MTAAKTSHPAKFPKYVLDRLAIYVRSEARRLGRPARVLDPFAGVGRIHDLPRRIATTTGVELEPEWAACRERTICGDATSLPVEWTSSFDVVATSPCYGNRLADHHEARDNCAACGGQGVTWTEEGCETAPWLCPGCQSISCTCGELGRLMRRHNRSCPRCRALVCSGCGGSGLSRRYTYRHALGRPLSERSAGSMQWGGHYRTLHSLAWAEANRVLVAGGLILVNIKNHVRDGKEQEVAEWHAEKLGALGFVVNGVDHLPAPGLRHGENGDVRVEHERVIVARKPL